VAEIDDFDLDKSTAQAWSEFQARLAEVLSMIDDSGDLTLGVESATTPVAPHITFSSPVRHVVRAEAAGPTEGAAGSMRSLGWQAPSADGRGTFCLQVPQEDAERLSAAAVATLRDVYGVPHPVFLAPSQLAEILQPRPLEAVPDRALTSTTVVVPTDRQQLDDLMDAELSRLYGHRPIRDDEGDIAIRVGSTMMFLRTPADGQEIVVFAAVVHDLAGRSRAAEVLNDLNVEARWVKFQLVRDRVFVTLSLLARPFVGAHLRQALTIIAGVADGIDEELAAKLGGRTTFSD